MAKQFVLRIMGTSWATINSVLEFEALEPLIMALTSLDLDLDLDYHSLPLGFRCQETVNWLSKIIGLVVFLPGAS